MMTFAPGMFAAWKSLPVIFTFSSPSDEVSPLSVDLAVAGAHLAGERDGIAGLHDACSSPSRSLMPTCGTSAASSCNCALPVMRGSGTVPAMSTFASAAAVHVRELRHEQAGR